jgi:hypothetical protein
MTTTLRLKACRQMKVLICDGALMGAAEKERVGEMGWNRPSRWTHSMLLHLLRDGSL